MKIITSLLSVVLLAGCSGSITQQYKAPWDKWYFTFSTPKALPAQVTLVKILDTEGYGHIYRTIDQPQGNSVGTWGKRIGAGSSPFNYGKVPPTIMVFCWDSIIDKKVYETTLLFGADTLKRMQTTEPLWDNPNEPYYFRDLVIGLAPEGKVRVWLQNNGDPNIEQTSTKITTVSGDQLDMCKGVTRNDFSRGGL